MLDCGRIPLTSQVRNLSRVHVPATVNSSQYNWNGLRRYKKAIRREVEYLEVKCSKKEASLLLPANVGLWVLRLLQQG